MSKTDSDRLKFTNAMKLVCGPQQRVLLIGPGGDWAADQSFKDAYENCCRPKIARIYIVPADDSLWYVTLSGELINRDSPAKIKYVGWYKV